MYDIIGDIHGHYRLLVRMLKKLGYEKTAEGYKHPERKIIFTGDYINRGPEIRETVTLIRNMVESGNALAILGNHELNAILYFTLDKQSKYFRKHASHLRLPLLSTIEAYSNNVEELEDHIKWFRRLPFYLDLGDFRVVHGGWNDQHIQTINQYMNGEEKIKKSFLKEYLSNQELNIAVNELTKGVELQLPKDLIIRDNKGISHRNFRIRWWEPAEGKTFKEVSFSNRFKLPPYTIPKEVIPSIVYYSDDLPPVFFGHYCLEKHDLIIKNNLCCVDRCVVRSQTFTAYRWNGEKSLSDNNLVYL
jgi:hypothetical protein